MTAPRRRCPACFLPAASDMPAAAERPPLPPSSRHFMIAGTTPPYGGQARAPAAGWTRFTRRLVPAGSPRAARFRPAARPRCAGPATRPCAAAGRPAVSREPRRPQPAAPGRFSRCAQRITGRGRRRRPGPRLLRRGDLSAPRSAVSRRVDLHRHPGQRGVRPDRGHAPLRGRADHGAPAEGRQQRGQPLRVGRAPRRPAAGSRSLARPVLPGWPAEACRSRMTGTVAGGPAANPASTPASRW